MYYFAFQQGQQYIGPGYLGRLNFEQILIQYDQAGEFPNLDGTCVFFMPPASSTERIGYILRLRSSPMNGMTIG